MFYGSRIYAEGNSYFAEIIYSWLCESSSYYENLYHSKYINETTSNNSNIIFSGNTSSSIGDSIYNKCVIDSIGNNDSHNCYDDLKIRLHDLDIMFWKVDINANSIFAYIPLMDISLFLLDNDKTWNNHPSNTIEALKTIEYIPSIIVLGRLNNGEIHTVSPLRYTTYAEAYPTSNLIIHHSKLPLGCEANFKNCIDSRDGHQCVPGPILRYTEEFARLIIFYSYLNKHNKFPKYFESNHHHHILSRNNNNNINNSDGNNNYFDHTDNDVLDITTDVGNKFDAI